VTLAADITAMDAVALAGAIRSRRVSCVEVMDAYIDRIERLNPTVNAVVSIRDRAQLRSEARERDEAIARNEGIAPLHGFPFAVKDLELTAGIRTTLGSPLFKDLIPDTDSILVERIKRAGAILIGKTNVPEFGLGSHTFNPLFGTTLNAYDQKKSAGGSSGGAAVALALRMLPVADGSDHGGSLRNPAAFNNVFGFRTCYGRVPSDWREIFTPSMSVHGPMARNVPDLALLLSVIAGYDSRVPLSIREDPARFRAPLERDFSNTRIAWLGDLGGYLPFEPGVLELCRKSLKAFEQLGCIVDEVVPEFPIERVWRSWTRIRAWQLAWILREPYEDPARRQLMKPEARWEVECGLRLTGRDISEAFAVRSAWYQEVARIFRRFDFIVLPSSQVFPFDAEIRWPRQVNGVAMDSYHRWMEVAIPVTMSGCPALNVPAGFNASGLPMGIQIVGPNHAEMDCLQLAHAYDCATGWVRARPPDLALSQ